MSPWYSSPRYSSRDAANATVALAGVPITASLFSGTATISNGTATTLSTGAATFSGLDPDRDGQQHVAVQLDGQSGRGGGGVGADGAAVGDGAMILGVGGASRENAERSGVDPDVVTGIGVSPRDMAEFTVP